jgi:hypothetical protein
MSDITISLSRATTEDVFWAVVRRIESHSSDFKEILALAVDRETEVSLRGGLDDDAAGCAIALLRLARLVLELDAKMKAFDARG